MALLLILCVRPTDGQIIPRFAGETIEICILDSTRFRVTGHYYLVNSRKRPKRLTIWYPFAADSSLRFPDSVQISYLGRSIEFKSDTAEHRIVFDLILPDSTTTVFSAVYTQQSTNQYGCYILTTTKYWKEPLEWGEYSIVLPAQWKLDSMNWENDTVENSADWSVYRFSKKDFSPDRDIQFWWKPKNEFQPTLQ